MCTPCSHTRAGSRWLSWQSTSSSSGCWHATCSSGIALRSRGSRLPPLLRARVLRRSGGSRDPRRSLRLPARPHRATLSARPAENATMPRPSTLALLFACTMLAACDRQPPAAASGSGATAVEDPGAPDSFAFAEADIAGLQARMADGSLDSHALTRTYLDRIAAINDAGPRLNA